MVNNYDNYIIIVQYFIFCAQFCYDNTCTCGHRACHVIVMHTHIAASRPQFRRYDGFPNLSSRQLKRLISHFAEQSDTFFCQILSFCIKTHRMSLISSRMEMRGINLTITKMNSTLMLICTFCRRRMDIFFWNPFLPCINMPMIF